ncbi:MAG: electron transfer flavoprotein subunit alpha/FixB family protein [Desulfobacteraceae bacterium]|nr:MAG: electron transfer flavoprotein subunit alpha/FixB family protein [Desulfobacteraceae bacterium]
MEKIGILIEIKDGELKKTNFGVIAAARDDSHELYAFLLDGSGAEFKSHLAYYGVQKIIDISSTEGPLEWNPVSWSMAIIHAMEHLGINTLLGLTSSQGKELLPRIAAYLDAPLVMDCTDINLTEHTVNKSQFSGKTIATIKVNGIFYIYGIRPNAFEEKPAPCEAEVIPYQTGPDSEGLIVKEIKQGASKGIELSEADIIISGGRGMKNSENFRILFECADVIGAAVGASRVAVDAEWVPYSMQVGQTGATVSPKVYIACGISGSVQHFAGMKTSGLIVAVNTDPEANITKNCDYYIVADLFEIVPILTRQLKEIVGEDQLTGTK